MGNRVAFTRDDRFLITTCADNQVRVWRTADGTLARATPVPPERKGRFLEPAPDGRTVLWVEASDSSGALVNQFQFFDLETGGFTGERQGFTGTIFETRFSPDGRRLAVLDVNGDVTILESATGKVVSNRIRHSINLTWVDWDPSGTCLLTAGHNDEILVWDAVTGGQLFGPLRLPGGSVRVAAWSPDGRFIVARNDDRKVRVWDAATGEAVTAAIPHTGEVAFARMNAARRLLTASYPDQLRAWDLSETSLPPDVLADYAKLVSGRRVDAAGVMLTLRPDELAAVQRSLRARAPQLFE